MRISYCTTCAQRFMQLVKTWQSNMDAIRNKPNVEWILLNYDSSKKLHQFVMGEVKNWPSNFVYARQKESRDWHASVAKNIAHQLGTGDILFNLDCDNIIADSIQVLEEEFKDDVKLMHFFSKIHGDGTYGRIAIDSELFYSIGGYDEALFPMAGQDDDLLYRVKKLNKVIKYHKSSTDCAIKNTKLESMKLCKQYGMTWEDFSKRNRKQMLYKFCNQKQFIANRIKGMTKPNVEIFKG